ncbi:MAG: hypothetical protein DMG91_05345 [Acidobacteria bacterium]|nr:MAG: hypothetical protein DMG91_05345 [Acidobacteriota bacterium]
MNPRLVGLAGPLQGNVYPLPQNEVSVGRESSNQLSISDATLSRRHCVFVPSQGGFQVRDLKSRNGTMVNGVPVDERQLEHGDQIWVGESAFVFLLDESENPQRSIVEFTETRDLGSLLLLRSDESYYLDLERVSAGPSVGRMARELNSLLKIASGIGGIRDRDSLQWQLLGFIFEIVPAERGAILLLDRGREYNSVAWDRVQGPTHPVRVSRTVVQRATTERAGVLVSDVVGDDSLSHTQSLRDVKVRSLLCVPLMVSEKVLGAIYLDTRNPAQQFDESHLQMMTAVAGIASLALDNVMHCERLVQENSELRAGTLLESEMFGHEKGAFTGATAQKKGKIEVAEGGTLFLDEVSELAIGLQAKLLRVLQEREFERVGGTRSIKLDVRVIAATNKNLPEEVKAGAFRGDLYYRLNVITVTLPSLRERREDIVALAEHFINKTSRRCNTRPKRLSTDAQNCLANYSWPGNVRELENAIERAMVLGSSDAIFPEDLPESIVESAPSVHHAAENYYQAIADFKRQLISRALQNAGGNYIAAAEALGVHPNSLLRLMRNLQIRAGQTA